MTVDFSIAPTDLYFGLLNPKWYDIAKTVHCWPSLGVGAGGGWRGLWGMGVCEGGRQMPYRTPINEMFKYGLRLFHVTVIIGAHVSMEIDLFRAYSM